MNRPQQSAIVRSPAELAAAFPTGIRGKHVHAVGAGGSGISAVLRLARDRGAIVDGCDAAETSMARMLNDEGIPVTIGHGPAHVAAADLIVTSPAVTFLHPDLPELAAAVEHGVPVAQWQTLLGYLMRDSTGVSVAGVHGKGTTTAMLGTLAIAGGLDPTVEVGAVVRSWSTNLRLGHGNIFLNEADEFNFNFLNYHPRVVVLTAIEYDHPEFFPSYEAIRDAFVQFLRGMDTADRDAAPPPTIALNAESPGCADALKQLGDWHGDTLTFAVDDGTADIHARDIADDVTTTFTLVIHGQNSGRVTLSMPGRHNISNALAAAAGAIAIGVPPNVIAPALAGFQGLRRRFEIVEDGDALFIDDYAHHPHAVAETIATARRRFPGRRLVAVFQPTLYTRLHRFLRPFSEAFDGADDVVIVETQASREVDTGLVHGNDLVHAIQRRPSFAARPDSVRYGGTYSETAVLLRSMRQPSDVLLIMGSGPVNRVIAEARVHRP